MKTTKRMGIDLGGTKIEGVLLSSSGEVLSRHRVDTPAGSYPQTLEALVNLVATLEETQGEASIGLGIPGALSKVDGCVKNANSTSLIGHPIDSDLADRLGRPIRVANDANCFALSEAVDGAGQGASGVFGVILGTGVGGGLVIDGKVWTGRNAIGGEWGHNALPWPKRGEIPGPSCYCGQKGCIEAFLSGPALAADHTRKTRRKLTPEQIVTAAREGDGPARATLNRYLNRLARALAMVINVVDPEVIVLGGGLSNITEIYEEVPKLWGQWVFSDRVDTELKPPVHGDASGVRGAAWLWNDVAQATAVEDTVEDAVEDTPKRSKKRVRITRGPQEKSVAAKERAPKATAKSPSPRDQPIEEVLKALELSVKAKTKGKAQEPQEDTVYHRSPFLDLGLNRDIVGVLQSMGWTVPTPIQTEALPLAMSGGDVIGLAMTGSGKTGAFALPLIQQVTPGQGIRALILSPTREIALQTKAFVDEVTQHMDLKSICIIGGVGFGKQLARLRSKIDIVIATPGRLLDLENRGNLSLSRVEHLVIDEADHMLDLGFMPQMLAILEKLPRKRRTMMFSATMPPTVERLARRFLKEPSLVDLRPDGRAAEGIEHRVYLVHQKDKKNLALALLRKDEGRTLIFTRRKIDAEWLSRVLSKEGHPVERIHSDLSQAKRTESLQGFRDGSHRIMVATDIAARGLDIPAIEHIVNFDLPDCVEDYVHRAGRTARAGATGLVSSIATWKNKPLVDAIEKTLGQSIPRCEVEGVDSWKELQSRTPRKRLSPLRR